jgi:hypothetical protein
MKARQIFGEQCVVSITATEAITAKRLVGVDGTHTAAHAVVGVALFDTDSGDEISVGCGPIEVVEAGAAIPAADTALETDSSGRVVTKSAGVTVGRNLDIAAGSGSMIRVALRLQ